MLSRLSRVASHIKPTTTTTTTIRGIGTGIGTRSTGYQAKMATYQTDTSSYKLNHTMLRVKNPIESLKFYSENFGLSLINKLSFPEAKFDLFFLAYNDSVKSESKDNHWSDREGVLELTHNYGTENDPNYKVCNGNSDPGRGFGHICISVDNLQAACARLEKSGVPFQKKLSDGRMKHIAFALDPDGYWVEIIGMKDSKPEATTTDLSTYRFNHTMIRVKDKDASLEFYTSRMGMSLLRTHESPENKFNLYFLGYRREEEKTKDVEAAQLAGREGLLELTWNYGTESDPNFSYHNGNTEPQGFGHICVAVDKLEDACQRFEDLNVNWKKRLTDGRMKNVAFIQDPDGYWVEIIQKGSM
ncbi:lactoylglutathione lyase [Pyronema domesticum]|uniref:Lactoylglutathione lyase n=1 Tax=Pyronema omphalodes (strain CBS 100304) TaxID=1076935 RepID=U4LLG7_PYROM|nr:lactoylglutathione lyase [Pyronema domesticum]CCX30200.1 Similar to Lactoylglutathione lyase; acc. no. Q09751 [Pyronema omphalodes CBS 100304]